MHTGQALGSLQHAAYLRNHPDDTPPSHTRARSCETVLTPGMMTARAVQAHGCLPLGNAAFLLSHPTDMRARIVEPAAARSNALEIVLPIMIATMLRACSAAQVCAIMKLVTALLMAHRTGHSTMSVLTRRARGAAMTNTDHD